MDENVVSFSEIISNTFQNIRFGDVKNAQSMLNVWRIVLLRIKSSNPNEGQNLVDHSRVVDLKNGMLHVEVDHPGWMELIQLHKKFILTGINRELPQLDVHGIMFTLKGQRANLFNAEKSAPSVEVVKQQTMNRITQEEAFLSAAWANKNDVKNNSGGSSGTCALPPELNSIFEDLKKRAQHEG